MTAQRGDFDRPPASSPTDRRDADDATWCTRRISSAQEDEVTYACGRPATVEALTAAGQWEPHCGGCVQGWPADRVRAASETDVCACRFDPETDERTFICALHLTFWAAS